MGKKSFDSEESFCIRGFPPLVTGYLSMVNRGRGVWKIPGNEVKTVVNSCLFGYVFVPGLFSLTCGP